jgi:hypothetical protein
MRAPPPVLPPLPLLVAVPVVVLDGGPIVPVPQAEAQRSSTSSRR